MSIKGWLTFRLVAQEHFLLHLAKFLSALLTPIATTIHLQYQTTRHRAITF
jgi:hypothetical protein